MAVPTGFKKRLEVLEADLQKDFVNLSLNDGRHIKLKLPEPLEPLGAAIYNKEPYYKKYVMQAVDTGADCEGIILLAKAIWESQDRIRQGI